ncbi:MAG: flippase-like domain-containing protein [Bacilli bacterium]|nr:flippase-like domain-containing protein [Bacilli bacterium]
MEVVQQNIKRQIIKFIIYSTIVLGLTALAFYLTIGRNASKIWEALSHANIWYIIAILAVIVGCILCRSIALFSLTRITNKDYFFHRAIVIDQVGSLFRMVTPAGLGSHIMEAHTYVRQGVRRSNALSVLAMYSIVYQVVLILYGILTIILKWDLINEIDYIVINGTAINLWILISIGFFYNVATIGFILLLSYWDAFFKFLKGPICHLLFKLHLIHDLEAAREHFEGSKDNFRRNLKTLFRNAPRLIICAVMFFIYITISYSVPYIAGLSVNNTSIYANYWDSVLLSNFHQMVTATVPIPGSSGISEYFFYQLFYPLNGPKFYSSDEIARASLLLWRGLMFIVPLFTACLFAIIYRPIKRKGKLDENHEDQDLEK